MTVAVTGHVRAAVVPPRGAPHPRPSTSTISSRSSNLKLPSDPGNPTENAACVVQVVLAVVGGMHLHSPATLPAPGSLGPV